MLSPLRFATAAGIGCFLAFIGLQKSEGIGAIVYDGATLVKLGGCPPEEQGHMYAMRDVDAYWHDWCWSAWRGGVVSSNLTTSMDAKAYSFFVDQLGLSLPINPSAECSDRIFAFATSPFPDVKLGLPNRSSNCELHAYKHLGGWIERGHI